MTLRSVIVAVVSSGPQAEKDKASIPTQLDACRLACTRNAWPVVTELTIVHSRSYRWLHDLEAASPDFGELTALIRREAVDLIVCYFWDRLWRHHVLQAEISGLCEEHLVQIYSVTQPIHPMPREQLTTGEFNMAATMMQAFDGIASQSYIESFKVKHRDGMYKRVHVRGLFAQGRVPYGYRRVARDLPLEIEPLEAQWVRYIYDRRAEGWGRLRIATALNESGVRTTQGNTWDPRVVGSLLANPIYAGGVRLRVWMRTGKRDTQRRVRSESVNWETNQPAIVSRELWDSAQRVGQLMRERIRSYERHSPRADLSGIARCGYCHHAMPTILKHGKPYYVCGYYYATGGRECHCNGHLAAPLDSQVLAMLQAQLHDPHALAEELLADRGNGHGDETARLEAQIADLRKRERNIVAAIESGDFDLADLSQRATELRQSRAQLEARLESLRAASLNAGALRTRLINAAAISGSLDTLSIEERNRYYSNLFRAVYLTRKEITLDYLV